MARKKLNLHLKEGALTATVKHRFGKAGFIGGKIKEAVLNKLAKAKGVTGKRARFALTMRKWKH
jgi:hypothetical protein